MDKSFYKCDTCRHHKVDLEKETCICILAKLNPKREDLLYELENITLSKGTFLVMSGAFGGKMSKIKHFHEWICTYHKKFLNCPGYIKEEI